MSLEAKVKEMEESFGEDTPREAYAEYGNLLAEIEDLYSRWDELVT